VWCATLFPTYSLAVMSTRHALSGNRTIEIGALETEPLLLLRGGFASRDWFEAACSVANIRPRVLLESGAPHTVIALAREGYGVAVVPSAVKIPRARLRAVPLVQRGAAIGRWLRIAWDAHRFRARYAEQFVDEIADYCRSSHPGREFIRRAPALPRPKEVPADA
jgi:DNA-binding transcriptional LysR family regulator